MARQLLLSTLVKVFGDFVDGLTEDNLKVGVWSGEILLENLQLNRNAVNKLNLPIDVMHGYVGSFRISIPWARLTSESINVEIRDVLLVAKPADPNTWDPEELRRKNLEAKRILLEKATEAAQAWDKKGAPDQKAAQSSGYFARLATRIADNIFVYLKNIHIRFEDPISDPTGHLCAGVIIQDFQIQSTNDRWEATFVSREEEKKKAGLKGKLPAIYKKIMMRGFAVYWNVQSNCDLGGLPLDSLLREMSKYEEIAEQQSNDLTYVINPVTLTVKLTHNEGGDPRAPVFSADVELPSLALGVQTEQYQQAMHIKATFDRLTRMGLLLPYRPKKSVNGDAKAWWHYAFFCVKKAKKNLSVVEVINMIKKRKRYIHLFEKSVKAQQAAAKAAKHKKKKTPRSVPPNEPAAAVVEGGVAPPLTSEEQAELEQLEETVPLNSLVVWRNLAFTSLRLQAKAMKKKASSIGGSKGGKGRTDSKDAAGKPAQQPSHWYSWFTGGNKEPAKEAGSDESSDDEEEWGEALIGGVGDEEEEAIAEGDISIDDLLEQAAKEGSGVPEVAAATAKPDTELFRVRLQTTSVISLYGSNRAPLMDLTSSLEVEASQKGDAISAALRLPHLAIRDQYTPNALFKHIAKKAEDKEEEDLFDLAFETSPRATVVRIRARPLDLVYNRGWTAQLLKVIKPSPETVEALAQQASSNLSAATAAASDAVAQGTLSADIEIAAPRIFVPLAESEDRGFLLLDTGHLSFKGGTVEADPASTAWALRLSQIQSKLLHRKSEWLMGSLGGEEGQLIEPFEISVALQMLGAASTVKQPGEADMSVITSLRPCIKGIFTPERLKVTLAIVTTLALPADADDRTDPLPASLVGPGSRPALGESALQLHRQVGPEGGPASPVRQSAAGKQPPAKASEGIIASSGPDPLHKTMEVHVDIPGVVLELRGDPSPKSVSRQASAPVDEEGKGEIDQNVSSSTDTPRLFILSIDGVKCDMSSRPYDSDLEVKLGALSIENLAKAKSHGPRRFLAQSSSSKSDSGKNTESKEEEDDEGLIYFRMSSYEDPQRAPNYPGHDRVIDLEFAKLDLKCDPESIRLLAPFYGALLRYEEELPVAEPAPLTQPGPGMRRSMSMASSASQASRLAQEIQIRAAAAVQGKTMAVTAKLARVSMELLTGTRKPVIMAEISGLSADVDMHATMGVKVTLQTFEVVDTQPESRDNAIRKLICPKQGLAEEVTDAGEEVVVQKPLLSATVVEDKDDKAYDIDLTLEDFTLNILVEAILSSLDVTLETVNALMDVLAAGQPPALGGGAGSGGGSGQDASSSGGYKLPPPSKVTTAALNTLARIGEEQEGAEEGDDHQQEMDDTYYSASQLQEQTAARSRRAQEEDKTIGLRVKVKLVNPGLILIENARNYDSRAVSMRGTYQVLYVTKKEGQSGTESIHVDAQGLEAFVDVVGGSTAGPIQIVNPFAVGVHMKRRSEREKLLVTELLLNLDRIMTRVAYHDVMLVQGILGGLAEAASRFQSESASAPSSTGITVAGNDDAAAAAMASADALQAVWDQEGAADELGPSIQGMSMEDERATKNTALMKVNCAIAGFDVMFINDYDGREQPLLEINLDDMHVSLESCADAHKGDGSLLFRARFFNPNVLYWEPLIEPWEGRAEIRTEASGIVVSLLSDRLLFIDITESFLQTMSRTYSLFLNASSGGPAGSSASMQQQQSRALTTSTSVLAGGSSSGSGQYYLTNHTGVPLTVDGGCGPVTILPEATVPIDIKDNKVAAKIAESSASGRGGRVSRDTGTLTLSFAGELGEQRKPLTKLKTDTPGTFIYPLKPVLEPTRAYPQPVVEETYENERSDRISGRWSSPFMPTDRPRWSNEQGKAERPRESIRLPGPDWRWQDDWHVDMAFGKVGEEIDTEGWTYGVEFPGFSLNRVKRTFREMDGVRRRRWIRTRVPVPPEVNDPSRPLYVAWSVDMQPDGRTELSVETTVKLVNETEVGLEVLAFVDPNKPPHPVDPIPPRGSVFLPVLLAYATLIQVRPLPEGVGGSSADDSTFTSEGKTGGAEGAEHEWSKPFLIDRGAGALEEVVVCPPASSSSSTGTTSSKTPIVLVVDATKASSGLASVMLRPPFILENYLPCTAMVRLAGSDQYTRAIKPGAVEGIITKVPEVSQSIQVKVVDFTWSHEQELGGPAGKFQNLKSFNLRNGSGEDLWVTGWVVRPEGSHVRLTMTLYTRYWLVDRTGLNLGFCENPRGHASRARAKAGGGGGGRRGSRVQALEGGGSAYMMTSPIQIIDFKVDDSLTKRRYQILSVDNGSQIYTDRPCTFSNLPAKLRRKTAIIVPNDDRNLQADRLLCFRLSGSADVYLLYDISGGAAVTLPSWIKEQGFTRVEDMLVMVNTQRHEEGVIKFQVFHKKVTNNGTGSTSSSSSMEVVLGGNKGPGSGTRNNYNVILVKDTSEGEKQMEMKGQEEEEDENMGLLLYDPRKPNMCVCVGEEDAWSKPLDIASVVDRGVFEVVGENSTYDLSLSIDVCPGVFWRTKQVIVTPRFVVVNCMDADVVLRQSDVEDSPIFLKRNSRTPFFWSSREQNVRREMQVMISGQTGWSYGGVNIENVGGTAVLLPTESDPSRQTPTVVHIEVKLAEGEEECAAVVALWKPGPTDPPFYAVHNYTPFEVHFVQMNVRKAKPRWVLPPGHTSVYGFVQMDVRKAKPRWVLPPGQTSVYGWEYPCLRHVLFLRIFNPKLPEKKFCCEVYLDKPPEKRFYCEVYLDKVLDGDVIDMGRGNGKIYLKVMAEERHLGLEDRHISINATHISINIYLRVMAEEGTKVLKIVTSRSMLAPPRPPSQRELTIRLALPGVGCSLVAADEEEGRREIGFFLLNLLFVEYLQGTREIEVEVKIKSMQFDNYVNRAIFPVIMCPRTSKNNENFIHFSALAEVDGKKATRSVIRYLALRILAMDVQLDLRSLLRYLQFVQQIAFLDYDRASAELHPARYIENIRDFYGYAEPIPWVDVVATCSSIANTRVYFERIDLHPLSVALSFVQTVADKRVGFGGNILEILKNFSTISRAPIKVRSFQVEHAMETPYTFTHIVLAHYKRQAFAQIFAIAGSLQTLGSPVDLVTSVGTGVKDFFYEPINGLVHSPKEFAKGLKKGTTSLLKGVVSGALNSVAGVGDSLNRNIAMLAVDREYTAEREQRRQAATAGGTGMLDGLKGGGESLVRGFADGIGGVFTAPIKEARTGGIGGFFKGVGKGVVGLAVKPIVGVSDAVVSVVQGASQAAQDLEVHEPVRPRRALPRLSSNGKKVLTDYSEEAANAQAKVDQGDSYVCHIALKEKMVIFTDKFLTIIPKSGPIWKHPWRDIAWCELNDYGILMHLYRNDPSSKGTLLKVDKPEQAYEVYEQLLANADKMGNGSQMKTLDQILNAEEGEEKASAGGLLDGYKFGTKNDQDLRCRKLRSWDIVERARDRLMNQWNTWQTLDDAVWKVINDWTKNHRGLNYRKCLALLIINQSSSGLQLQGTDLRDGSEIHVIETSSFDKTSRLLSAGGAVLVFAWSHIPTLVKKAHISFTIDTSAFTGQFTQSTAHVKARPGYEVSFLEKTKKDDYAKFVVKVNDD